MPFLYILLEISDFFSKSQPESISNVQKIKKMMLSQKCPKTLFYLYWGILSHFTKKYPKVPKIPVRPVNGTGTLWYF